MQLYINKLLTRHFMPTIVSKAGRCVRLRSLLAKERLSCSVPLMVSQQQADANRRNAAKSTGPKTAQGKAASSRNAVQHGVLSEKVVSVREERKVYDRLLFRLVNELRPETAVESTFVERLANLIWRERRLADAEAKFLTQRYEDSVELMLFSETYVPIQDQFLIGRYQSMLGRQIRETLSDLRAEQDLRIRTIKAVGNTSLGNAE